MNSKCDSLCLYRNFEGIEACFACLTSWGTWFGTEPHAVAMVSWTLLVDELRTKQMCEECFSWPTCQELFLCALHNQSKSEKGSLWSFSLFRCSRINLRGGGDDIC